MPVVTVTLTEPFDPASREGLSRRLAEAIGGALGVPPADVVLVIEQMPAAAGAAGRSLRRGLRPAELVRTFLRTVEARDLDRAKTMLADGFSMTFPGDRRFARLEELLAWARERYGSARKTYERFDEAPGVGGVAVYCYGTLSGQWLDGTPFSGIRFVDRFTVRDGKLIDQRVWNDLAEVRAPGARTPP